MRPLFPSRLRPGDLIGLISPASTIADPARIDRGVTYLESLGYKVIVGRNALATLGYLAGTDEERVDDLHTMFSNKSVKGVLCIRGGYGTPRLLPLVNYRLIASNPKIFVGYSDITALMLAMWKKAGLVTFHGPMLGVDMAGAMDPYAEEHFWRLVTSGRPPGLLPLPSPPITLSPGRGEGRLLGGNVALLQSLLGTPFQPDFRGSLLFLEDIGEEPYRIDRMLAHLRHAGVLEKVRGILGGQFTDCGPRDPAKPTLTLDAVLGEYAAQSRKPFLARLPIGHEDVKATIPIGVRARLDATAGQLTFLEAAVH